MNCSYCDVELDEFEEGCKWESMEGSDDILCNECIKEKIDSGELKRHEDGGLLL